MTGFMGQYLWVNGLTYGLNLSQTNDTLGGVISHKVGLMSFWTKSILEYWHRTQYAIQIAHSNFVPVPLKVNFLTTENEQFHKTQQDQCRHLETTVVLFYAQKYLV
jgi:hypothetical protein